MIDIQAVARAFVGRAIQLTRVNIEMGIDNRAIDAAHNKTNIDRTETLVVWLAHYAGFQGFTHENRHKIADAILSFGDEEGCHSDFLAYDTLIDKFRRLHGICGKVAPLTKVNKPRDLISLASKGLWCCYPNAVPIFDRYVQNVLWVFCKLAQIRPKPSVSNDRYAAFADVWFQIHEQVDSIIKEQAEQINYPYNVRIFDRILWLIGQPYYSGDITSKMF